MKSSPAHKTNLEAWNAGHAYLRQKRERDPSWAGYLREGGHCFTEVELGLIGHVQGIRVLQLSCAGDAAQAFSFANLGAQVWACDFSKVAIEEARENAGDFGIEVEFGVDDSTVLSSYEANSFDLVHVDGNLGYYQDLMVATRNWFRVLQPTGLLVLHDSHPFTSCLEIQDDQSYKLIRSYHDRSPEHYQFGISDFVAEGDLPAIEFRHTMDDIVNAVATPGFKIEKMVECTPEDAGWGGEEERHFPPDFYILARK